MMESSGHGGCDDDSSQATCATLSSDESGNYIDQVQHRMEPKAAFAAIERNDPYLQNLNLLPYDPVLPPTEWIALGRNIGSNTSIKKLQVCADGIVEGEDEIASTENLEAFCSGLSCNRSLRFLMIEEFDFERARLELLQTFLVENSNLTDLRLYSCGIGAQDVQMLSNAFSRRRHPMSIMCIALSGEEINDESAGYIVEISNNCPNLRKLDLGFSRIGNQGCNELTTLLENPASKLKRLQLVENCISDEGALVLANATANNNTLKALELDKTQITTRGWDGFLRVLCDTSSINATFQSNHVLRRMWLFSWTKDEMDLPDELLFFLQVNAEADKIGVARQKIFRCHLNGNFSLVPFEDMDAALLPTVLGWIGKGEGNRLGRVSSFYRILQNFPDDLCSFPSPERMKSRRLEEENAALKADNDDLRRQIEQLRLENEELRSNKRSCREVCQS